MIDTEVVESGLQALGVAIAMLVEDAHEEGVRRLPPRATARSRRIAKFVDTGKDVAALAAAMEVLQRRR